MRSRPRLSELDRTILALAVPALGALAADPLYSLVDTAFIGNLGTPELGAAAIGSAAFNASFWLFSFLAYGVTPRVAGAFGRDDRRLAGRIGVQALLLALLLGAITTVVGVVAAGPIVRLLGGEGPAAILAEPYLRIRSLSAIPVLLVTVGHGWLRGAHDTRTPMLIVVAGAALNVVLDYLFIYPFGWGIEGAAWATVAGQSLAAVAFAVVLARRMHPDRWALDRALMTSFIRVGADLVIRAGAIVASLTVVTAIAARMGLVVLGAWQVTMQVFTFLALSLDSVAIAAQAIVGRALGSARGDEARTAARRLMSWGLGLGVVLGIGLFALRGPAARAFSDDPAVVATASGLLAWLAIAQPLSAAAFTLDGILIGASDTRFLAGAMTGSALAFIGAATAALALDAGPAGLAAAATLWLGLRTAILTGRLGGPRWSEPRPDG